MGKIGIPDIVSIADAYDAITTDRPYHAARAPERAFEELFTDSSRGLRRADLVNAFITLTRSGRSAQRAEDR